MKLPRMTRELLMLSALLVILGAGYAFLEILDEVNEGELQDFDEWLVTMCRRADDPALPVGPAWFREAMMDATGLGSTFVLGLVSSAALGYLLLVRRYRQFLLMLAAILGGTLLNFALKYGVARERPSVVPHLREVTTPSFPSGHSMMAAIVYMTIGILIARVLPKKRLRTYCVLWGILVPLIVGVSRVYLGVHYPTDVVGGWAAGLAWALACWLAAEMIDRLKPDTDPADTP